MATTTGHLTSTTTAPLKTQPLWRLALVGLGPLSALGIFGLGVALFQRLT